VSFEAASAVKIYLVKCRLVLYVCSLRRVGGGGGDVNPSVCRLQPFLGSPNAAPRKGAFEHLQNCRSGNTRSAEHRGSDALELDSDIICNLHHPLNASLLDCMPSCTSSDHAKFQLVPW